MNPVGLVDAIAPAWVSRPEAAPDKPAGETAFDPRRAPNVLVIAFQTGFQADGGVESLTQLVTRYDGIPVTMLTQAETSKNARWRRAGARVLVWPAPFGSEGGGLRAAARRWWRYVAWNIRVARLVRRQRIDVAHVNDHKALWHSIAGLRLAGVPIVYNIRDTKPRISRWEALKWRGAFALTRVQVVLSREMQEFWREALGIRGRRLIAIPSVVDFGRMQLMSPPERRAVRERLGLPGTFVAGYVASFSGKKAQLDFIEQAGPALKELSPAAQVWFLGDFDPATDPYAAACRRAVDRLGLGDQFKLRGCVGNMEEWYAALDAVVVATRHEGLARCMIESLACGTPVVSFDVASAREILEAEGGGVVVPQGDYAGLVDVLVRWAAEPEERAVRGRQGAEVARRKFAADGIVAGYLAVYESLRRRGGRP